MFFYAEQFFLKVKVINIALKNTLESRIQKHRIITNLLFDLHTTKNT